MTFDWEVEAVRPDSLVARAFSPTNIALAKYWGKRNLALNLPQNSSLSVTLGGLGTFTTVEFNKVFTEDTVIFDGDRNPKPTFLKKAKVVLELIRKRAGCKYFARIQTKNNFPTGAGLASSASGLSALALAAASALSVDISKEELSTVARQGSGSASRSLFDGFAIWNRGKKDDGKDSLAQSIASHKFWPFTVFVAVVEEGVKKQPSTDAMELTRKTSPYFASWVDYAEKSTLLIQDAILSRDFDSLAKLAEENCVRMHASAMAAQPPLLYWEPQTIAIMKKIWELRAEGHRLFFTIDAGPNVVIFMDESQGHQSTSKDAVRRALGELAGINILETKIGEGAKLLEFT